MLIWVQIHHDLFKYDAWENFIFVIKNNEIDLRFDWVHII